MKITFETSRAVLVVGAFVVAIYDFVALASGGSQATISYVIWVYSKQYPIVAGLVGVLFGHLLWQYLPVRGQSKSP